MFGEFNFDLLDDEDFKEDSVREELLLPILKRLGYTASGVMGIVRAKALVHPFVMIGSQPRKINIIPDYLLTFNKVPLIVIDAKAPNQAIIKSHHVEQAFSYAIHPDVRVYRYALFNGRELVVYDVDEFEPILYIKVEDIDKDWSLVEKTLSVEYVLMPEKADFAADTGLYLLKSGFDRTGSIHFVPFDIFDISMHSLGLYTSFSVNDSENGKFGVSLDYNQEQLDVILSTINDDKKEEIISALKSSPYMVRLNEPIKIVVETRLGELQKGQYEDFVPFIISKVDVEASKRFAIIAEDMRANHFK